MVSEIGELLSKYKVATLGELSKKLNISLDKIKNISCGRTSFNSLFKIKKQYRIFPNHCKDLAEVIGIVLGDGNIYKFDRCQRLTISCDSLHKWYIKHICCLIEKVLKRKPGIVKRRGPRCVDVRVYLQDINLALGLPAGNKLKNEIKIPEWIFEKNQYLKRCIKGLFETDGHYGKSKKFYVEYMQLCNYSRSLRKSTFDALKILGYAPQMGRKYVRIARKAEVRRFIKEMKFIRPFPSLAIE